MIFDKLQKLLSLPTAKVQKVSDETLKFPKIRRFEEIGVAMASCHDAPASVFAKSIIALHYYPAAKQANRALRNSVRLGWFFL